jgi:uncharacterized protein (DUF305 family)
MAQAQASSSTETEQLQNIMVEVARTQLAAVTAALKFWGGWVESADKYTQKISAELEKVSAGGVVSQRFAGQLTDFSREYLREMIALPNVAVEHFATELEKISKPPAKRTRKARAKE